jgi:hypothetical protein
MSNKNVKLVVAALGLLGAGMAHAQTGIIRPAYQFPTAALESGPAAVQVGDTPLYFTPYIGAAVGHDDNLFLTRNNTKSSSLYVVSPGMKLEARDATKVLQLTYNAQIGRYGQSEDDDYVDQTALAQYDMAIDRRNFLRLGVNYLRSHDPRGSTDRPPTGTPDKYRQNTPYVTYALGAPGAEGRVEAYYSDMTRKYLNNRQSTAGSDRSAQEYGGTFYWRVWPKTYLLAEVRETNIRYDQPGSLFSADERRYFGGVTWEATAATTGTLKIGNLKRRFISDEPNFSGTSWEATITWAPRTYSRFDFYSTRTTNESTGLGNFILADISGITWSHNWSSVLSTQVLARYEKDDYQGFDRNDKVKSLGLKAGYKFRRWLTLGAEYTYTKRDSNQSVFEYDRNLYLLTATASM